MTSYMTSLVYARGFAQFRKTIKKNTKNTPKPLRSEAPLGCPVRRAYRTSGRAG